MNNAKIAKIIFKKIDCVVDYKKPQMLRRIHLFTIIVTWYLLKFVAQKLSLESVIQNETWIYEYGVCKLLREFDPLCKEKLVHL